MKALSTALMSKFTGSAFATAISNKLFNTIAPQDRTFPYCTFTEIVDRYDWQFALNGQFEDVLVQFSIFSNEQSPVQVEDLYDSLIALYDWAVLSITGYSHLYMRRDGSTFLTYDTADKYWMKAVTYRCFMEKS